MFFWYQCCCIKERFECGVLDPVVGESSSWISTTAVFRTITAREI